MYTPTNATNLPRNIIPIKSTLNYAYTYMYMYTPKAPKSSYPGFAPSFFWHCTLDFFMYIFAINNVNIAFQKFNNQQKHVHNDPF